MEGNYSTFLSIKNTMKNCNSTTTTTGTFICPNISSNLSVTINNLITLAVFEKISCIVLMLMYYSE